MNCHSYIHDVPAGYLLTSSSSPTHFNHKFCVRPPHIHFFHISLLRAPSPNGQAVSNSRIVRRRRRLVPCSTAWSKVVRARRRILTRLVLVYGLPNAEIDADVLAKPNALRRPRPLQVRHQRGLSGRVVLTAFQPGKNTSPRSGMRQQKTKKNMVSSNTCRS